jgi:putative tricarboxylic transport membrane protein
MVNTMKLHDAINGLIFMALGLAVLLIARSFPQMPGQDISPASFPNVIGAGMLVGGGIVAALAWRRPRARNLVALEPGWRQPLHLACVAFFLLGSLVFAIWFETIGFPLGALTLCTGIFLLSGLRKPMLFAMAVAFIALITLVMTRFLSVPLPMGSWL